MTNINEQLQQNFIIKRVTIWNIKDKKSCLILILQVNRHYNKFLQQWTNFDNKN